MNDDTSTAHEKAWIAAQFIRLRRKFLHVKYTVRMPLSKVETSGYIAYLIDPKDGKEKLLLHYNHKHPLGEAYANGKVKHKVFTPGNFPIVAWRFADKEEIQPYARSK